jgi:hypothetical protein
MNAIEIVKRANIAYNAHDADALAALYADDASYSNPHAGQGVTGKASVNFPKAVWAAYPDAFVELISVGDTGQGTVAVQWVLRKQRWQVIRRHPSCRNTVTSGAAFIRVERIKFVGTIYYDRQNLSEQLGLKAK